MDRFTWSLIGLLAVLVSTPASGADQAWQRAAERRIDDIRMETLTVDVVDGEGNPIENAQVQVQMKRPAFAFGTSVPVELFADRPPRKMPYGTPHMVVLVPREENAYVSPSGLPEGAEVFMLAPGEGRTADYGYVASIPSELRSKLAIILPRGSRDEFGAGYSFKINTAVDAYLFVQNHGKPTVPIKWKRQRWKAEWTKDPLHYIDSIYKASFAADSTIEVPPHDGNPDLVSMLSDEQIQNYRRQVGKLFNVARLEGLAKRGKYTSFEATRTSQAIRRLSDLRLDVLVPDKMYLGRSDVVTTSAGISLFKMGDPNNRLGDNKYVLKPIDPPNHGAAPASGYRFYTQLTGALTGSDSMRDRTRRGVGFKQLLGLNENNIPYDAIALDEKFVGPLPDIAVVEQRLAKLAEFNKPIVITSLKVSDPDRKVVEQYTRDLLTLFYSHPAVTGVMVDGLWDALRNDDSAQMFDHDWLPKPMGKAWLKLVADQWTTNRSLTTDSRGRTELRGHLGGYTVMVTVDGRSKVVEADLTKGGSRVEVQVEDTSMAAGK